SVTSCGSRNTTPAPQRSNPMRFAPSLALVALVACAAPLAAQETPTERSAAADVVRRMNTLERSLALPALVARLTGARDPRRDAVLARARSEEHTSELQSPYDLVCRLLLEKKKTAQ